MAELEVGSEYRRQDLHARFGGQQRGGISTPVGAPVVMLFSGSSGEQYGYHDGFQADGTYWYTGEGQVGDMQMRGGNRAIHEAESNGKMLLLFEESRSGIVRFSGPAVCVGHHISRAPDREGNDRSVIVFELAVTGKARHAPAAEVSDRRGASLPARSLAELRAKALESGFATASAAERRTIVRQRSEAVKRYVLARSKGVCESCGAKAPFIRISDGSPYLEPHHTHRVADDGPDHPRFVGAVCPTCHRHIHHGVDGSAMNARLIARLAAIEPME